MAEKQLKIPIFIFVIMLVSLAVVAGGNWFEGTNSYLASNHSVRITTFVENANLILLQDERELVGELNCVDMGAATIEADTAYITSIKLKNDRTKFNLYVRYKVDAWVDSTIYNITEYVSIADQDANKFYLDSDGWMYYGDNKAMDPLEGEDDNGDPVILSIMESFTIPSVAENGKLGISDVQGKTFELYLCVEASSTIDFGKPMQLVAQINV